MFQCVPPEVRYKGVEKLTKERHSNAASGLRLSHENRTAQNTANAQESTEVPLESSKICFCMQ